MSNQRDSEAINKLAAAVKKYRLAKNLTQQELANTLNTDVSHISRIELGKVNTTISTIYQLAKAFDIKPSLLLED